LSRAKWCSNEQTLNSAIFRRTPLAGPPLHPFPLQPGRAQLWNSLLVKNADTITAVSETTVGDASGIWAMDGHFHPGGAKPPGVGAGSKTKSD
jgi:hypothetical protein